MLLGPPGGGKTEAFKREAEREGGHYITARDFLTFEPEPEWRDGTLYIDGLDETRARAADGRTPFDGIRAKLQRLGRPRFRLSCREADWFGANDRERLTTVAPDRTVLVLRLDPLAEDQVLEILGADPRVEDAEAFLASARERGVDRLLNNPQNLEMLTAAVASGVWPATRLETFDLACRILLRERNHEHQIAGSNLHGIDDLMDAAGHLCAMLLLGGKAGVTLPGTSPHHDYPGVDQVPGHDQQLIRQVAQRAVFESPSEGRVVPAHRLVAESLAARRLAQLIDGGLPAARVLALMTGFDGGIMTEFRGLAAWLSVHSKLPRGEIIERDPLGTVLYGDVRGFSAAEKRLLFQCLKAETGRNPWLTSDVFGSSLGALASHDLEEEFRHTLSDPARDDAHQSFVLLTARAIRDGEPIPALSEPLMDIMRDDTWQMTIRCATVDAYARTRPGDDEATAALRRLLDDVYAGVVGTSDDDLLGALLTELYPGTLSVPDIVGYLREPERESRTRYQVFWTYGIVEQSTIGHMLQLLDLLEARMKRVRSEFTALPHGVPLECQLPGILLRHLLGHSPGSVSERQLFHWLASAAQLRSDLEFSFPRELSDADFFRNWLGVRPNTQKAIIEQGLIKCERRQDFDRCMCNVKRSLFDAEPPADYGTWCADKALVASNRITASWLVREAASFVQNGNEPNGAKRNAVAGRLAANGTLTREFEERLATLDRQASLTTHPNGASRREPARNDDRFAEMRQQVRDNETVLRANQCPPYLLHHLARAYLNFFADVPGETPEARLRCLLGSGDELFDAALAGLRGAILRADLPTFDAIIKLAAEGRAHLLAYPFMAGLEALPRDSKTSDLRLDETRARLALAIHFLLPRPPGSEAAPEPPGWLRSLLIRHPGTVSEVWARCVRAKLRNGEEILPDVYLLAREPAYAPLARAASIPLLEAFPASCKAGQLEVLQYLLQAACLHGGRTQLLELIETKLGYKSLNMGQRVYWLAAGLFLRSQSYAGRLESYVGGRPRRVARLTRLVADTHTVPARLSAGWDATALGSLIRLIGPFSVETVPGELYTGTWRVEARWGLSAFIDRLAGDPSETAGSVLESLAADGRLCKWRSRLLNALQRQKAVRREARFTHPGLDRINDVLENRTPVSAGDLAALTAYRLADMRRDIRDGANSAWRQYWNVDQYDRPTKPKPENACRRALLEVLKARMDPMGIDAQPEGGYADQTSSDIRLACGGFNVPVEIKRSCHPKLWSAIRDQLIAQYTRDPGADGFGIYLVFWFGGAEGCRPTPGAGPKPKSAAELEQALVETLSVPERRKISVCVIDVSKPAG